MKNMKLSFKNIFIIQNILYYLRSQDMSVIFYRTQQIVQGIWSSYVLNTYNRKVRYTILQCTEYVLYMSAKYMYK